MLHVMQCSWSISSLCH